MSDDNILKTDRPLAAMDPNARDGHYRSAPENMIDTDKSYQAIVRTD